ncbi:MAG: DUF393 domain-containing protein [Elusimicrobia bacterium]|nr:DUF393 domain-containing protein [Elusimicrobiota bacterium]
MKSIAKWWNDQWFRPAPLLDLAAFRIVAVGAQLLLMINWNPLAGEFPHLVQLRYLYQPLFVIRILSLPFGWGAFPTMPTLHAIFWATVLFGVLALVGLWTNVVMALFAIGCVYLQGFAYSFQELHHPEALMMLALVTLALSPCGRRLSLDDLLQRLSGVNARPKFHPGDLLAESPYARWPIRMMAWLYGLIYLSAAYWKSRNAGLAWMNGYTLQYYLLQDALRFNIPIGLWMASRHGLAVLLSAGAMLFEATFWLVIPFPKLLALYAPAGFGMHAGILLTMKAGFWEYLALYGAFVPWSAIALRARRTSERQAEAPSLVYDGHCYLCLRSMTVIDFFDWAGRVRYHDLEDSASMAKFSDLGIQKEDARREIHLILPGGRIFRGFFAFRRLCWTMPAFWPLLPLFYAPGASIVGPAVYARVARARRRFIVCDTGSCEIHGAPSSTAARSS